jgi:hypothetical protein
MSDPDRYTRLIPLGFWLDLAERVGVPYVPAEFSPPVLVAEMEAALEADELDGPELAPTVGSAYRWLSAQKQAAGDQRMMARWECCTDDAGKARAARGEGWSPAWTRVDLDSPRVFDCTVGEVTRLCVRPWVDALRFDGYPVEFRVYYGPDGFQGVSNYHPQRSLAGLGDVGKYMVKVHWLTSLLAAQDAFPVGFTADFIVSADPWDVLLLEGGPPHEFDPEGRPSAHPCCFPPGQVRGLALEELHD